MLQLIDDLLTFSRSEHQQMKPSGIDMGELARAVFEELKSIIPGQTLLLDIKTNRRWVMATKSKKKP